MANRDRVRLAFIHDRGEGRGASCHVTRAWPGRMDDAGGEGRRARVVAGWWRPTGSSSCSRNSSTGTASPNGAALCLKIWVEVQESGAWLVGQARRAAVPALVQRLQPVRRGLLCGAAQPATAISRRRNATGACTRVPCVLACQYVLDSQEAACCRNGRRAESGGPAPRAAIRPL